MYVCVCMYIYIATPHRRQNVSHPTSNQTCATHSGSSKSFYLFNQFIYLWLCWISVAACKLSLAAASRGYSLAVCLSFSLWWPPSLWNVGSRDSVVATLGLSSCGTWIYLPQGMGDLSSWTRDRTHVSCIGRQILNHWQWWGITTNASEVPPVNSMMSLF